MLCVDLIHITFIYAYYFKPTGILFYLFIAVLHSLHVISHTHCTLDAVAVQSNSGQFPGLYSAWETALRSQYHHPVPVMVN